MDIEKARHYIELDKIIKRSNQLDSTKLARILSYISDQCKIDQNKYYIAGNYSLKEYNEYQNINHLDIYMANTEFRKLRFFKLGEYTDSNTWILDMKKFYKEITGNNISKFYIKINKGFLNRKYSINSLVWCELLVDEYKNLYFSPSTYYQWLIDTKDRGRKDKQFMKRNNLIKDSPQCGGSLNYKNKYNKYKYKYMNLINK